jgi:hypothetical protein
MKVPRARHPVMSPADDTTISKAKQYSATGDPAQHEARPFAAEVQDAAGDSGPLGF